MFQNIYLLFSLFIRIIITIIVIIMIIQLLLLLLLLLSVLLLLLLLYHFVNNIILIIVIIIIINFYVVTICFVFDGARLQRGFEVQQISGKVKNKRNSGTHKVDDEMIIYIYIYIYIYIFFYNLYQKECSERQYNIILR